MKLPEFSVNRRVSTAMIAMILVVMGIFTFTRLGLDFFPDLEFPTVSVVTTYRGASSEDIEKTITKPLEQVVSSISRVKKVTSSTSEGASTIQVEFEWGTNLDFAAQDIRDQIGLYRQFLPPEASDPLVVKFNLAQLPVLFWGITGSMPNYELKKLIEDEVAPRLERIDGVASAPVFSMDVREILVDIDKSALESRNLPLDRVIRALAAENINLPAGFIQERHTDLVVRTMGEFESLADVRQVVVGTTAAGEPIFLGDIAEVKDTLKETRYTSRIQQQNGVFLMVSKRSGANTAITGEEVKKELARIRQTLPADVQFHVAMDQSDMVRRVAHRTSNEALQGALLAILMIFLFLRDWRPTLIIALAIPLSIIATFIAIYFAGYTLNMLTLGGLALGIGMLLDCAIVVIENTFRHVEGGADRKRAAIFGASEVGMAVTASMLTTIVVFLPMLFAQGITGKLTKGLGLSITASLVASLFVALTIVPMLSYALFKPYEASGTGEKKAVKKSKFQRPREVYRKWLLWSLERRRRVLLGTVGLFVIALVLVPFLGMEFMPSQDQDMILLMVRMPVGTALEETDRVVGLVEKLLAEQPEVTMISAQAGSSAEENPSDSSSAFSPSGPHEGLLWVGLIHQDKRKRSDRQILENIRSKLPRLESVRFESVDMSQMITGSMGGPIAIKIFGKDLEELRKIADDVVAKIREVPGLRDLNHTLSQGKPEYQIRVDRERAAKLGLMVSQVASAVQTATVGQVATRFREENEEIDLRVRFQERFRDNIWEIENIPLVTPLNKVVYVGQVAAVERGVGPIRIARENQSRLVTVTANIAGRDLGRIVRDIRARLGAIDKQLPPGYFIEFGGSYQQMTDAFKILAVVFAMASLLVYMIMASQFESFRHPFIIMFTVPLGLIGVVFGLLLTGKTISLSVWVGFIILAGVVVDNAIVMIDYINQLRQRGVETKEAIVQGSVTRLRAVLLTALTTMIGMLPMAISTSEGAEFRSPMAITVLAGMTVTTVLTLFVIPAIYSWFEKVSYKKPKPA
jgi:HAE1 family hydrophobic/amphiphilic exporter-1